MWAAETRSAQDKLTLWRLFILGRSLVTGAFLLVLFGVNGWTAPAMLRPLFMVAALQFAINGVYFYLWAQRDVTFMGHLCFIVEVALITLLILFFGPGGHVFVLAYLWPIIMAGWLLGPRVLLSLTLLSTMGYALVFGLTRGGALTLAGISVTEITYQAFTLSLPYLAFIALLSWLLTKEVRRGENDLRQQNAALCEANARLRMLLSISEDILSSIQLDELTSAALDHVANITGHDTAALYVCTEDGQPRLVRQMGPNDRWPKTQQIPMAARTLNTVTEEPSWRQTSPIVAEQPGSSTQAIGDARLVMTQVALRSPRGLEGILSILSPADRPLGPGQTQMLQILGHQLGTALENAKLFHTLQHERNRLQGILSQMSEAVIVANDDGVLLCNRAATRMLGVRQGHALPAWFTRQVYASRQDSDDVGLVIIQVDGRSLGLSLSRLDPEDDAPPSVIYVARDMTEQIQAERTKSDFVAYASHELRTPLTTIKMMLPLLLMDTPQSSKNYEYLKVVEAQVERQRRLVNNLLDLARLETGHYELPAEWIDAQEVIAASVQTCSPLAGEKGIALIVETPDAPIPLHSNGGGIEQVLVNLLTNAIKFTDVGGHVVVSCSHGDVEFSVAVRDTGIGMSPQEQERIFQKFYTVRHPRKRGEGTGLGLVISRLIAEELGGHIEVESEVGVGSCFTLHLPLSVPVSESSSN